MGNQYNYCFKPSAPIDEKFGLTYSAVSRHARIYIEMLTHDKALKSKFENI